MTFVRAWLAETVVELAHKGLRVAHEIAELWESVPGWLAPHREK